MRLRSTGADQLIANPPRKGQIGKGAMQVPQFAATDSKFNAAEAMVVSGHAVPTRDSPTHRFDRSVLRHHISLWSILARTASGVQAVAEYSQSA
jgi:hypothetical protein